MKRIEYIDILKGIGIVLVVLGHITKDKELFQFIYAFHMPLFFIVSGYFLHEKKSFIISQAKSLLVPYFVFGILSFIYWWLIELPFRDAIPNESACSQFINLFIPHKMQLCNVVLWFLPCLFITSILAINVIKYVQSIFAKIVIILLLIPIVGLLGGNIPFLLGQSAQALPFMLIGYIAKQGQVLPELSNKNKKLYFIIMGIIGLLFTGWSGVTCNMINSTYTPNYPVAFIVALMATCSVVLLAYTINRNKVLSWLGINSLAIMLIHEPVKRVMIKLYSMLVNVPMDILRESIIQSIIITIITIITLIPIILFVNKYTPFLLGKTNRN